MTNLIYYFLTKYKPAVVVIVLIGLAASVYTFWPHLNASVQTIKDSPCSNNTVNQSGGSNTVNCDPTAG